MAEGGAEARRLRTAIGLIEAYRATGNGRRRSAVAPGLAEPGKGGPEAAEQAMHGLTALCNMFVELYADCAGLPVDVVLREAAAALGDPYDPESGDA
jgi:hypothetical protein